jgi:ABC-type transport system involved in multi-copper enzyme maturation permease subunit
MPRNLLTIAHYALLEAARNRLLYVVVLIIALALAFTVFLKQVAITETRDIQLAFLAASFRLAAVFVVAAFVIVSQVREANDKVMELLLTRNLPRAHYLFGKLLGYLGVALVLSVLFTLPIALFADGSRALAWGWSLFFELAIVAALSLFCVLTLNQVVGSLAAVLGAYALARSMAALQLIGSSRVSESNLMLDRVANYILDGIAFFLPRLDMFTQTAWLLHRNEPAPQFASLILQSLVYVALLGVAALFDFKRKNF